MDWRPKPISRSLTTAGGSRRSEILFRALFAAILIAGLILRLHDVGTVGRQGFDAFHYARQAQIVLDQGNAGLRVEAAGFGAGKSMWGVPPPWRAGFLYATAGWMALTNTSGPDAVAYFAAWTDELTLVLLGVLAWRMLGALPATVAMALYAFSPPMLQMARHGWEEPLLSLFGLALLIFGEHSVEDKNWWWPALLGTAAGFSITVKELAFIDAILVGGFTAFVLVRAKAWTRLRWLGGAFLVSFIVCGGWIAWIVGGPSQMARYASGEFSRRGRHLLFGGL